MKIKAYLIDPKERTLTEHEIEQHDIRAMHELLGVDCFDSARFDRNGDIVYVDDEGLLKEPTYGFFIEGYPTPLAGRGLVLGSSGPDSVSPRSSIEEIRRRVTCLHAHPLSQNPDDKRKMLVDVGPPEILRPHA